MHFSQLTYTSGSNVDNEGKHEHVLGLLRILCNSSRTNGKAYIFTNNYSI